jgi:hypothetical protein
MDLIVEKEVLVLSSGLFSNKPVYSSNLHYIYTKGSIVETLMWYIYIYIYYF